VRSTAAGLACAGCLGLRCTDSSFVAMERALMDDCICVQLSVGSYMRGLTFEMATFASQHPSPKFLTRPLLTAVCLHSTAAIPLFWDHFLVNIVPRRDSLWHNRHF
jgi:hypothetical protein